MVIGLLLVYRIGESLHMIGYGRSESVFMNQFPLLPDLTDELFKSQL